MGIGRKILAASVAAGAVVVSWTGVLAANAAATDLIFSEYVEGSGNNKAVEIFNGTGSAVDLDGYVVELYSNGNTASGRTEALSGSLGAGRTLVLKNSQADPELPGDLTSAVTAFNGNDALVLRKGPAVVDSIGRIGDKEYWGKELTLVRKPTITMGDTNTADEFDPATQWEIHNRGANPFVSFLGSHEMEGVGGATPDPKPSASPDPKPSASPDPKPSASPDQKCAVTGSKIGEIQGDGEASGQVGNTVEITGVVVGDFQEGGFKGFYLQDAGDGNPATSDGIFVYDGKQLAGDVRLGDALYVKGGVKEHFGLTQLTAVEVTKCGVGQLPDPTVVDFPNTQFEPYEGMLVSFKNPLTVLETYQFGRFGQIAVGPQRQFQPTALFAPDSPEAKELLAQNKVNRVLIDDGRSQQNPTPALHPATLQPLSAASTFRAGDRITGLQGVLDYRYQNWAIQPVKAGAIESANSRPAKPNVGGDLQVGSFNVLNYFTTLKSADSKARGADNAEEFARQEAKIVAAINKVDGAIMGLNEIQNNAVALDTLVAALNKAAGSEKWAGLKTGKIGSDAITTAFIYQPALVETVGDFDILTSAVDSEFNDGKNRPTLAQTFRHKASGESITVAVNHLKSKGSECGDPSETTSHDLVGNCNETRTKAAAALANWLKGGQIKVAKSENILIIGDMNSYDHEDPIEAVLAAGFTDQIKRFSGEKAYSYVFDGQLGYLDHALANEALAAKIVGASEWNINSDELSLIDYNTNFKKAAEQALYRGDEFRSSDHDPVLVGIKLSPDPDPTPSSSPTASPSASEGPTINPLPTDGPDPSNAPTATPSARPSSAPTAAPNQRPTAEPSQRGNPRPGLPKTGN